MLNGYSEIIKITQFMVEILYSKKKTNEIETAKSYLNILVQHGDPKQVVKPLLPHIIEFATQKKTEILKEDFNAFLNYDFNVLLNSDFKNKINIPQLINIYKPLLSSEEQTLMWKKIKQLIAKAVTQFKLLT